MRSISVGAHEGLIERSDKNREVLKFLDAGYNLARWLIGNEQDANEAVQEAYLRAFQFSGDVENPKTWFLTIVRHTCYKVTHKRLPLSVEEPDATFPSLIDKRPTPEYEAILNAELEEIRKILIDLPETYREVFVLREIEELSYQEISEILEIPIGTTMSRLARSRSKISAALKFTQESKREQQ